MLHPAAVARMTLFPQPLGPASAVTPPDPTTISSAREVATRGPGPPFQGPTSRMSRAGRGPGIPLPTGRSSAGASPSRTTRSAAASSIGSWVAQTTASPRSTSPRMASITRRRAAASRWAPGSSAIRSRGAAMSAAAINTCCCCPAESVRGSRWSRGARSRRAVQRSSARWRSASARSRLRAANTNSSTTVGWSIWTPGSCRMTARSARNEDSVRARREPAPAASGRPSSAIAPSRAGHRPPRASSRLVLPPPLGPVNATHSPAATSSETPRTTGSGAAGGATETSRATSNVTGPPRCRRARRRSPPPPPRATAGRRARPRRVPIRTRAPRAWFHREGSRL